MNEEHVPGPDDGFRWFDEFDCSESLPPGIRATIRSTRWVPTNAEFIVFEFDCSDPTADPPPGS